jgi:hypothetical protein
MRDIVESGETTATDERHPKRPKVPVPIIESAGTFASKLGCLRVYRGIRIYKSPVCYDNGIIVTDPHGIECDQAITLYPGYYHTIKSHPTSPLKYAIRLTPPYSLPDPPPDEEWVLDAVRMRVNKLEGVGHFINSCHPQLPHPYNTPNCIFVEDSEDDCYLVPDTPHPPLVYVSTICFIPCGGELLVDYHWLLNGLPSPMLLNRLFSCSCVKCTP